LILCFTGGHAIANELFLSQALPFDGDTPKSPQADRGQKQPQEGAPPPATIANQFTDASGLCCGSNSGRRLGHNHPQENDEQRRQHSKQVCISPLGGDHPAGQAGQPSPQNAGGVKDGTRLSSTTCRKSFRDHSRRHRPLAADADRHQETQHGDLPKFLGECGQAGEHRICEDGQHQNRPPTPSIGQRPEADAAEGPADEEHPEKEVAVKQRRVRGPAGRQVAKELAPGDVEDLPFVNVENPARRCKDEDQPLRARDVAIPGERLGRGLRRVHVTEISLEKNRFTKPH
jgi:hypothetical protein